MPADLDAEDVASLLVAVSDGLQLQWLLQPDKVYMSRRLYVLWQLLSKPV